MKNLYGLLAGASPFISLFVYDILKRKLLIELIDDPRKMNPLKRIVFIDVLHYTEEDLDSDFDNEPLDSVIGLDWVDESTTCIKTDNKEVLVKVENPPVVCCRNYRKKTRSLAS